MRVGLHLFAFWRQNRPFFLPLWKIYRLHYDLRIRYNLYRSDMGNLDKASTAYNIRYPMTRRALHSSLHLSKGRSTDCTGSHGK